MATDEQIERVRNIKGVGWIGSRDAEALAAVLDDHARLRKAINDFGKNPNGFDWAVLDKLDEQDEEIAELKAKLAASILPN